MWIWHNRVLWMTMLLIALKFWKNLYPRPFDLCTGKKEVIQGLLCGTIRILSICDSIIDNVLLRYCTLIWYFFMLGKGLKAFTWILIDGAEWIWPISLEDCDKLGTDFKNVLLVWSALIAIRIEILNFNCCVWVLSEESISWD